jgi:hypothetical protein
MSTTRARLRPLAVASLTAVALAIIGFAGPAYAADPTGAVTHSNLVSVQSAATVTIDFDYALVDPLAPGTITIDLYNYAACGAPTLTTLVVPVVAAGHYSTVVALGSNGLSQVAFYQTDGVSSVYQEANFTQDNASPLLATATVLPDADPATGQVQLQTGYDRWTSHYQLEIDGVPTTAAPSQVTQCATFLVPYSGLALGSTLTVVETDGQPSTLATFVNPLPAAPAGPAAPAAPPTTTGGSTTGAALPVTGRESLPVTISAAAALVVGVLFFGYARRRRGQRAAN